MKAHFSCSTLPVVFVALVTACAHTPKGIVDKKPKLAKESSSTTMEGTVQEVVGDVQIQSAGDGKMVPLVKGQKVPLASAIVTGDGGRAKVVMPDKNEFHLAANTKMAIQTYENSSAKKSVLLNLIKGKVRAQVREKYDGTSNRFLVKTSTSVSGVRGTDFAMSFDGELSKVVTFDGSVQFGLPGADDTIVSSVSVEKGQISKAMPNLPPTAPKNLPKDELDRLEQEFVLNPKEKTVSAGMDPEKALNWLRNGNARYVKSRLRKDGQGKKDIQRLVKKQGPHSVIIASSDSRIPPELVFDQKLGEVFVTRSMSLDQGIVSSAEYAVTQLGIRFLLVLGHTGDSASDHWTDPKKLAAQILEKSEILKRAADEGTLVIHSAVYDLNTGFVQF